MSLNFTNKQIKNTYDRVVQVSSDRLYDGLGNEITFLFVEASLAATASYIDPANLPTSNATLQNVTENGNSTTLAITASAIQITSIGAGTFDNLVAADSDGNLFLTSSAILDTIDGGFF